MADRQYICIDLKSFYASVECVERGLDPMTARLVVADPERSEGTVCLAVSPAMKKLGVKNRCRVFEIPKNIDYIKAPPRMQLYIDYSAEIYGVYLKYIAKEDILVYSIDEVFMDVTDYLWMYKMTARELGEKIRRDVLKTVGIPSAFGVGTNLYLAKIALDITAKHSSDFVGELDESTYKQTLWDHTPLTDFWRIGKGLAGRFAQYGIYTMRDIAHAPHDLLKKLLGVDYEILLDHANGIEPTTIADVKAYESQSHSLSSGQVLMRDYSREECLTIVKEMADSITLELFDEGLVTRSVTLSLTLAGEEREQVRGTHRLSVATNLAEDIIPAAARLYEKVCPPNVKIRKVNIVLNDVVPEGFEQFDLFTATEDRQKQRNKMQAVNDIKKRFGKSAILRGLDLKKEATARERNGQIGGHKSGDKTLYKDDKNEKKR